MNRGLRISIFTLAMSVAVIAAIPAPAATGAVARGGGTGAGPAARAAAYDDAVIAVMKLGAPLGQRVERFRGIVAEYYDMPGIAALVAGPAWASASAADRQAMIASLTRHSAISLAKNFKRYDGERFEIDPDVQQRGDSMIVKVTIKGSGGSHDVLYYRMRGARIVDVVSGGVSQLAVQRSDLASTAAGGVTAIVVRLDQIDAKTVH